MFNDYFRFCHLYYSTHHPMVQTPQTPGPTVSQCSMIIFDFVSLISNTDAEKTPLSLNVPLLTILCMSKSLFFQIHCGRISYRKLSLRLVNTGSSYFIEKNTVFKLVTFE